MTDYSPSQVDDVRNTRTPVGPYIVGRHFRRWAVYHTGDDTCLSKHPTPLQAQAACDAANRRYLKKWQR